MRRFRPRTSRLWRYLRRLFLIALLLGILCLAFVFVQNNYHTFDAQVAQVEGFVASVDTNLTNEAFAGISEGSLALVLGLCLIPLFFRKIDGPAYIRGIWRGLVSAVVFLVSAKIYDIAGKVGRFYLLASIAAVIIVTALLVEGVSLAVREENERSFRTDIVASISAGLIFGVVVKLLQFGLGVMKLSI